MEFNTNYNDNSKKSTIIKYITLILNLIISSNSLSVEIKTISNTYISEYPNDSKIRIRNLSEQYIYGSAFKINYYYSNLYLGEDMQKQGYILDTGSTITSSTCTPICQHCGKHLNPPYNIKSEYKIIPCSDKKCQLVTSICNGNLNRCSFNISYSEGSSLNGVYINEIVRFGENYKDQIGTFVPIGCTTEENHLFFTQDANGIMGLANNDYNFVNILYKSGAIQKNIFSLCLAQLGGVFNIGEFNNKTHKEEITFVPMLLDRGKYFGLNVKSMSVNDKIIKSYSQWGFNIFIDSGTTISYMNDKIFNEILTLMKDECNIFKKSNSCGKYVYHSDFGHCFYFDNIKNLNNAVNNYWPIIHFYLDGYDYKWRPENYVFNISTKNRAGACMGINKQYGTKITLGSNWIIGHDVVFDRKNRLIGFAEAECFQNKMINYSNGLELKEEIIKKIKNGTLSLNNILNEIDMKNKKINNYNILEIILIVCIVLIIIILIIFFTIIFKYFKEKYLENIKKSNSEITYIKIHNDDSIHNNKIDIV